MTLTMLAGASSGSVPVTDPARLSDSAGPSGEGLLEAIGLVRQFGPVTAVDDVSFTLSRGEVLALFGPNGAGKTTLLRLLGGALRPDRGTIRIGEEIVHPRREEWRRRVGLLSHQGLLYSHLTCAENLDFYGRLYGFRDLDARVHERLERVGLSTRRDAPAGSLSRGMRQRLALARALLHDPEVVLLDEPYAGLDAQAADVLREVLMALKDGSHTVLLVTHNLTQGLELADRVAVQVRGRFVWEGRRDSVDPRDFERTYRKLMEGLE